MATLQRGTQTITVPDAMANDYIKQGWAYPGRAAAAPKPKRRRPSRAKAVKNDGVPVRTDGDQGTAEAGTGSVQPEQDNPGVVD